MFVYEKDGKLNIMVASNKPAAAGVTPDIVIEPVAGTPVTAVVTVNGDNVAVGGSFTQIPASTDVSDLTKLVTALTTAGIIASA